MKTVEITQDPKNSDICHLKHKSDYILLKYYSQLWKFQQNKDFLNNPEIQSKDFRSTNTESGDTNKNKKTSIRDNDKIIKYLKLENYNEKMTLDLVVEEWIEGVLRYDADYCKIFDFCERWEKHNREYMNDFSLPSSLQQTPLSSDRVSRILENHNTTNKDKKNSVHTSPGRSPLDRSIDSVKLDNSSITMGHFISGSGRKMSPIMDKLKNQKNTGENMFFINHMKFHMQDDSFNNNDALIDEDD